MKAEFHIAKSGLQYTVSYVQDDTGAEVTVTCNKSGKQITGHIPKALFQIIIREAERAVEATTGNYGPYL